MITILFYCFLALIKIALNQVVEFPLGTDEILSHSEMLTSTPSLVTDPLVTFQNSLGHTVFIDLTLPISQQA